MDLLFKSGALVDRSNTPLAPVLHLALSPSTVDLSTIYVRSKEAETVESGATPAGTEEDFIWNNHLWVERALNLVKWVYDRTTEPNVLKKSTLAVFFSVRIHLMEGETTWITSGGVG